MIMQLLGCHHVPPYHEPMGYSSTYVKALKTGTQGGARPLHSVITRVKPVKQRTKREELQEQCENIEEETGLPQPSPDLPPEFPSDLLTHEPSP